MPHQCTNCGHTFADGSKEMLSGCPDCGGNKFQFSPSGTSLSEAPADGATDEPSPDASSSTEPAPNEPSASESPTSSSESSPEPPERPEPSRASNVASKVGRTATKVRDALSKEPDPAAPWPDEESDPASADAVASAGESSVDSTEDSADEGHDADIIDADARRDPDPDREDLAQASARSELASDEDIAAGSTPAVDEAEPGDGSAAAEEPVGAEEPAAETPASPGEGRVAQEPTGEEPSMEELRKQLNDQFESIKIVEPGQYELNLMELYDREEYIIALQENGRYVIQVPENWMGDREDRD